MGKQCGDLAVLRWLWSSRARGAAGSGSAAVPEGRPPGSARTNEGDTMNSRVMKAIVMTALGMATVVLSAACGNRAEDVCESSCAKIEECSPGASCTCKPDNTADCSNEDEILDHIDSCNSKA